MLSTPEDTSVCVRACRGFLCTRSPSRLVLGPKFPVSELLLPLHSAPCGGPGIPRQARSECSTLPVSVAVQEHTLCSARGGISAHENETISQPIGAELQHQ